MNPTESPTRPEVPAATQSRTTSYSGDREPRAAQTNGAMRQKCPICKDPIGESCFCKIHRKEGGPVMLFSPSCVVQYLDSARPPADDCEQQLRAHEKSTHFIIGEDKPWL